MNVNSSSQKLSYQNYYNTTVIGLAESYTFTELKWLESYNSFDISYSYSTASTSIANPNLSGANAFFSTNNTIYLNTKKTLRANITFWYNFKGVADLDRNTDYSQLNLSIRVTSPNKKLVMAISTVDILSSNRPIYTSFSNNVKIDYKNYYDNRSLRLSLLWFYME